MKIKKEMEKAAPLFLGSERTMIASCLEGYMGRLATDREEAPASGRITVGDFCLFGGRPDPELVKGTDAPLLVPGDSRWGDLICRIFGKRAVLHERYEVELPAEGFDKEYLQGLLKGLDPAYELRPMGREEYELAGSMEWSKDLRGCFGSYERFEKLGLGVVLLHKERGILAAGASSYTVYSGGIEIQIDTKEEFRRQGLALVCGAWMILSCLERGICPGWDAHDLRSAALAEKLGYHKGKAYECYLLDME